MTHGTCVLVSGTGVLLRGPSGAGKSDLALRLMDGGAVLVADDRVVLGTDGDAVVASPPSALAGLIEVRGIGILPVVHVPLARVGLVVDLVSSMAVDRMPESGGVDLAGCRLPGFFLAPFEASAPAKIRFAVQALENGRPGSGVLSPMEEA